MGNLLLLRLLLFQKRTSTQNRTKSIVIKRCIATYSRSETDLGTRQPVDIRLPNLGLKPNTKTVLQLNAKDLHLFTNFWNGKNKTKRNERECTEILNYLPQPVECLLHQHCMVISILLLTQSLNDSLYDF